MTDATSPQGTADAPALSLDDGAGQIANLLKVQDTPDHQSEEGTAENPDGDQASEPGPDAVEATAEETADDGSEQPRDAKGRFIRKASPDDTWSFDDGTEITIGELARNNLYQRDYTRKTMEHAEKVKAFEARASEIDALSQTLAQQREFLLSVAPQFLPQEPSRDLMQTDPLGYMTAKAEHEEKVKILQQVFHANQQEQARLAKESEDAAKARRKLESDKLLQAVSEFREPKKYEEFWRDANDVMTNKYGLSPEELSSIEDHRVYLAIRDLIAFHKAKSQAPKVQEQVQKKPPLIKGGVRVDAAKEKASRQFQQSREQLRKTGSFEDGVAALQNFKL